MTDATTTTKLEVTGEAPVPPAPAPPVQPPLPALVTMQTIQQAAKALRETVPPDPLAFGEGKSVQLRKFEWEDFTPALHDFLTVIKPLVDQLRGEATLDENGRPKFDFSKLDIPFLLELADRFPDVATRLVTMGTVPGYPGLKWDEILVCLAGVILFNFVDNAATRVFSDAVTGGAASVSAEIAAASS